MPALTAYPTEWEITIHRRIYVVIRRIVLASDEYWRVVTGEGDRTQRRLIGYWGTFDEAGHNPLAWVATIGMAHDRHLDIRASACHDAAEAAARRT